MSIFESIRDKMLGDMSGKPPKKVEGVEDQSLDELKLCAYIKSKVEESRSSGSRIAHEGIWMTNTAYVLGFDSVFYDTTSRSFKPIGLNSGSLRKSRTHVNKILPTIQNRLARLAKNMPRYDVRPNSIDADDRDAARLGMQIVNDVWDREGINVKRLQLLMYVQQCGYAFLKCSFDPRKGRMMRDPETGGMKHEGDIRIDVVSAFEMFEDPLAKTLDECQWVCQAKVRKLDYFRTMYPEKGHLVKEEGAWLLSAQYEARINSLNNQGPVSAGTEQQLKNAAIELAYYEQPSEDYPNGRLIITANNVLLHDGELPCGVIPFTKFDDVIVAGKFKSESIITHLRPVQDQFNRLVSKRAQWTNLLLAGKYLAPKGHGMSAESLNDQSGEVLEYNPVPGAGAPQALSVPSIPQYAYVEEERLTSMFNDISGIGELSRGTLPQAGIPAIGMQFLQEQDETRIGVITEQHEQAYAKLGQLILMYASNFYKTPRLLKLAGSGLGYTVRKFVGADLKGNTDVIVVRGSTLPNSKVLKRQELMNAFSQGLLGNQQDPELLQQMLGMMEFGDVSEVWHDLSLDLQQFKEQLEMIKRGEMPPIDEADNHKLHYQRLNRFRKTDAFDKLDAQAKIVFYEAREKHLQEAMKLMNPTVDLDNKMADEMLDQTDQTMAQVAGGESDVTMAGAGPMGEPII